MPLFSDNSADNGFCNGHVRSLQFFLLLAVLLCFFLLTSQGLYVQLNLYDRYLRQHGAFFVTGALALVAFVGMGVYSLVSHLHMCSALHLLHLSQLCFGENTAGLIISGVGTAKYNIIDTNSAVQACLAI